MAETFLLIIYVLILARVCYVFLVGIVFLYVSFISAKEKYYPTLNLFIIIKHILISFTKIQIENIFWIGLIILLKIYF